MNVFQVSPYLGSGEDKKGKLYRGPQPRGNVAMLRDRYGVTDIICLQRGWFDAFNELIRGKRPVLQELKAECVMLGVRLHEIPCSDFRNPTKEQTSLFVAKVDAALGDGRSVYVHCLHGKDRTGWMCATWRVLRMNWSADAAIEEWNRLGHHRRWYRTWNSTWREMVRSLK